jgi:hypothetical protein
MPIPVAVRSRLLKVGLDKFLADRPMTPDTGGVKAILIGSGNFFHDRLCSVGKAVV